ncbi:MAG: permease [Gallionella sp.]|nr:permease [Gallionella sp.]
MMNEIALALLFALFGWKIALLYLVLGLSIAIFAGYIIGCLKMEAHLEDWVQKMAHVQATVGADELTLPDRIQAGFASVREIVDKV